MIFVRDLVWKGQRSTLTPTNASVGAAGAFGYRISLGKGSHSQQTPSQITEDINLLFALQTTAARASGRGWDRMGGDGQQLPETLGRSNLTA